MELISALLPEIQREVIRTCVRRSKGLVAAFVATTVAASSCTVAGPLIFAYAVARIGEGGASPSFLIGCFVLFALSIAGARLLADVKVVLMNRLEQEVRNQTNKDTLAALLRARGSMFAANNPSKISALVQNLHQSNTIYIQLFMMVLLAGASDIILAFGAIAGYVNWYVAVFVLVYGVASVWLTLRSNDATTQYQRRARAKSNEGANLLGNVVSNVVTLKVFRGQRWVSDLYDRYSTDAKVQWNSFYRVRLRYGAVQAGLVFAQYASIFAMLVLMLKSPDMLNQVVMVSMILIQLNRPFEMIASSLRDFVVAKGLAEPLQTELDQHNAEPTQVGKFLLPKVRHLDLSMSNLSFAYAPDARPVLTNVSARFAPGRLNFIVGPSGVGKSSLLQILLRINETYGGSVKVGGVELGSIDADSYLAGVGYVPQEPMLMNLSIRDNVLFGRSYSDDKIKAVLDVVKLGDKLASLPGGLDFVIGERGQLLSGGERQRLAITRALIGEPQILVLDEASSALDEETERSIFASLRAIAGDTTVIAVTHRLGVITPADQVLNLSKREAPNGVPCRATVETNPLAPLTLPP